MAEPAPSHPTPAPPAPPMDPGGTPPPPGGDDPVAWVREHLGHLVRDDLDPSVVARLAFGAEAGDQKKRFAQSA